MTGRTGDGKRPFIRMNGFKYTEKYLKLEKYYIVLQNSLCDLLNAEINKYIPSHKLTMKVRNISVHDLTKFFADINGWADERLDLSAEEKTDFHNFIKRLLRANNKQFKEWEKATNKIKKMIRKTSEKCQENMLRIEEVYGEVLIDTLNEEDTLYANFNVLEKLIQELKDGALVYSDFVEVTGEYFEGVHHYLEVMDRKLEFIKDEVEEININTNPDY